MIRITHFRNKCIGCNACVESAPLRWRINPKDGKAVLVGATEDDGVFTLKAPSDEWEEQQRASANCPVSIIRVQKW
jgi:ferredoxin